MLEGHILAIDDLYFHDQGAYVRTHAARVVHMTAGILPGPYRVPAYRAIGHFRLTNKTPAATYRAPGRYETTFVRERLVDAIATRLGIDPNEVRRRNAIAVDEMPYHRPLEALGEEIEHDSGDYVGLLDKLIAALDWDKLKADLARRRAAGEAVGAGFAMFVEKSGLGPADGVRIEVDTSGRDRAHHRRRLARPGFRDRDGAGLRRDAGRRLPARARHPWPDRPHRVRHRRACLARDRDDGVRHPQCGGEAASEGDRGGGRADAGALRRARPRRRQGGPQGSAGRAVDEPGRDRRGISRRPRRRSATASPGSRSKAGSGPRIRSIPTASISRW